MNKFEVKKKDGEYLPDEFYSHTWTPEQRANRERAKQFPEDHSLYFCKRHPDFPLVLTVDPDLKYCALCTASIPYSILGKE